MPHYLFPFLKEENKIIANPDQNVGTFCNLQYGTNKEIGAYDLATSRRTETLTDISCDYQSW